MSELSERGLVSRRKVLGDVHVDRAIAGTTDFDQAFQALITDAAWGHVWSRGQISLRERSMLTIALLAAQGADGELEMHLKATKRTGASPEDVIEALLHVALYAGIPRANHAIQIAKRVLSEDQS